MVNGGKENRNRPIKVEQEKNGTYLRQGGHTPREKVVDRTGVAKRKNNYERSSVNKTHLSHRTEIKKKEKRFAGGFLLTGRDGGGTN